MGHRIPRRVHVGRGYFIDVQLLNGPAMMEDLDREGEELDVDGYWDSELGNLQGNGRKRAGRIVIWSKLSKNRRWDVYFHELIHAINDIMAYDRDHSIVT